MSGAPANREGGPRPLVPVGLRVEGRPMLVVGAGRIAARKAKAYLDQGAEITVVAPDHGPEMNALDVAHRITRGFEPCDLKGQWLVVTATGIPAVDGAVYREAEKRRIWCNAADDPQHCSVILPAVVRRGGLTVSIASGGRSPATASWLRRRLAEFLDDDALEVLAVSARVRDRLRESGMATELDAWAEILDRDALDLVTAGRSDELERRLLDALILEANEAAGSADSRTTHEGLTS